MDRFAVWMGAALCVAGAWTCAAHDDIVDRQRGLERTTDVVVGQGRNTSQDRAYAIWAQHDDNLTEALERPFGKRTLTVAQAIPWAKRLWDVNILDETCDASVGEIRFRIGFGAVEREMALPLFLEALAMAVGSRQDCYLEQDEDTSSSLRRSYRGTVHIRKARPLQPDYDHPLRPDKAAIRKLEEDMARLPKLTDQVCAPSGRLHERCMDCQARVAEIIQDRVEKVCEPAANFAECLAEIEKVCLQCRHCHAYWISKHETPHQPEVQRGTSTVDTSAPAKK